MNKTTSTSNANIPPENVAKEETVQLTKTQWDALQAQLKMLTEVADKGRMFNYQASQTQGKQPLKVKVSVLNNAIITGWRTIKDELVKHPTTGVTVGEQQQYEVILTDKEGKPTTATIDGYKRFSEIRYTDRIECDVVGKREDWDGKITFDIVTPDGQQLSVDSRFVN